MKKKPILQTVYQDLADVHIHDFMLKLCNCIQYRLCSQLEKKHFNKSLKLSIAEWHNLSMLVCLFVSNTNVTVWFMWTFLPLLEAWPNLDVITIWNCSGPRNYLRNVTHWHTISLDMQQRVPQLCQFTKSYSWPFFLAITNVQTYTSYLCGPEYWCWTHWLNHTKALLENWYTDARLLLLLQQLQIGLAWNVSTSQCLSYRDMCADTWKSVCQSVSQSVITRGVL